MRSSNTRPFLRIGLTGFTITVAMNLLGWFVFHRHSSEYFSPAWWSAWYPNYVVWFAFTVIGFFARLRGGAASGPRRKPPSNNPSS